MTCKNEKNQLTVNLNITDQPQTSDLQAYVFSSGGTPLGSAPIATDNPAVINMPENMDGRGIQVLLGPLTNENEKTPDIKVLIRNGAYALPGNYQIEKPVFNFDITDFYLPLWCTCNVTGRVINRVTLPDGSTDEMPVCNARVNICEVDQWRWILPRIPDFEIFKLRDDLLEKINPRRPPFPRPDPDSYFDDIENIKIPPINFQQANLKSKAQTITAAQPAQQFALATLSNTQDVNEIRSQLLQLNTLIFPYWCYFSYLWPYYRSDCIRTVDVDSMGRFSTIINHNCNDQPDLYFWVEQLREGVWNTVYRPGISCNTYWNYECGSEIVINAPAADPCFSPDFDVPSDVSLYLAPDKIGTTYIWGTPEGAPSAPDGRLRSDGLLNHDLLKLGALLNDSPFGGTLNFYQSSSYFIPKDESDIQSEDIKYYRYSYRRKSSSTTAHDWTPMTSTLSLAYQMDYSDSPFTTEFHTIAPVTINSESGLFEFKPRTPPIRDIDPPTVTARSWSSGRLNDVVARWDTMLTAPAISDSIEVDSAGLFEVKIEVFNIAGQLIIPDASTFEFIVREEVITQTRRTAPGEVINGAFTFNVHIDNNQVTALLPQPSIDGIRASDDCGFLRYDFPGENVHVEFTATHPNNHAVFDFMIKRGSSRQPSASTTLPFIETANTTPVPYHNDSGVYHNNFSATELVGTCINAAFAARIDIWNKATNGKYHVYGKVSRLIAFALAEHEEGH